MKRLVMLVLALCILMSCTACGQKAPTWQEQYDVGIRYLSGGDYEEAIIAFTAAIKIDPKRVEAYVGRGNAYIGSGETEENLAAALADYEKAIELDEADAEAYLGLADVYIRQGDFDKAQNILETGLEKTGDRSISDKLEAMKNGAFKDSSGNVRKSVTLDGEGNLLFYHVFDYDADGRKQLAVSYDSNGAETSRIEYSYDSSGNMIEGSGGYNPSTGEFYTAKRFYGDDGKLARENLYRDDGTLWCYHTWEYDALGNETKWSEYSDSGRLVCYDIFAYDQNNRCVRSTFYDGDDAVEYYYTRKYDDEGYEIKRSLFDAHGNLSEYEIYVRDNAGKILRTETYNASGALTQTETFG